MSWSWLWRQRNVAAWILVGLVNAYVAAGLAENDRETNHTARVAAATARDTRSTARDTREAVALINRNRKLNARQFAKKDRQLCDVTTTLLNMQVDSTRSATALFRPLFAGNQAAFERAVAASRQRVAKLRRARDRLACDRPVRLR